MNDYISLANASFHLYSQDMRMDFGEIHSRIRDGMNEARRLRTELRGALRTVATLRAALQEQNVELNHLRPLVGLGEVCETLLEDTDDEFFTASEGTSCTDREDVLSSSSDAEEEQGPAPRDTPAEHEDIFALPDWVEATGPEAVNSEAPVREMPMEKLFTTQGRTEFRMNSGFSSLFARRAVPPGRLREADLPCIDLPAIYGGSMDLASISSSEAEGEDEQEAAVAQNDTDIPCAGIGQDPMDTLERSMDLDIDHTRALSIDMDCTFADRQDILDLALDMAVDFAFDDSRDPSLDLLLDLDVFDDSRDPSLDLLLNLDASPGSAPSKAPAEDEVEGPSLPRRSQRVAERNERAEREKRAREAEEDEPHQDQPPAKRQRRKRRTKMEGQLMRYTKKQIIAMYDEEQKEIKRKDKALAAKERRINSWKEKHKQLKEENRQNRRRRRDQN